MSRIPIDEYAAERIQEALYESLSILKSLNQHDVDDRDRHQFAIHHAERSHEYLLHRRLEREYVAQTVSAEMVEVIAKRTFHTPLTPAEAERLTAKIAQRFQQETRAIILNEISLAIQTMNNK